MTTISPSDRPRVGDYQEFRCVCGHIKGIFPPRGWTFFRWTCPQCGRVREERR